MLPTTQKQDTAKQHQNVPTNTSARFVKTAIRNTDAPKVTPDKSKTANQSPVQQKMPTPILPNRFEHHLKGYDQVLTKYVIDGFTKGFRIHATAATHNIQAPKNSHIAVKHPDAVSQKISKELSKGTIAGPFKQPPFPTFQISPLSLRPKNDGSGWRLLHDLSYPYDENSVNQAIPNNFKHVKYSSVQDAINIIQDIGKGAYMAKADIASAFTLVPIHPDDYHLLGFKWDNSYYYYKTLPQGAGSSCFIFERISTALQWILQTKIGIGQMVHYLDDFLFISNSQIANQKSLQIFKALCDDIRIPINNSKTEGPTRDLIFLGIRLNSTNFTASLPVQKVRQYTELMESFLKRKTCTLREMQQVIGSLQFTTSVVRPGRTFIRRMINATIGVSKPYHHVHLTNDIKQDIKLWLTFIQSFNGINFFIPNTPVPSHHINLHTDSCPSGYGGTFRSHYFYGKFPTSWAKLNICVLELYPILLALQLFAHHMKNTHIVIYSDNIAVVAVLNKKTTKHTPMLKLLRHLVLHCLNSNILFTAEHISGKLNILPDALSRCTHTPQMLQAQKMDIHPTEIPENLLPHNYKM